VTKPASSFAESSGNCGRQSRWACTLASSSKPFVGVQFALGKRLSSRFRLAARCADPPFDLSLNEFMASPLKCLVVSASVQDSCQSDGAGGSFFKALFCIVFLRSLWFGSPRSLEGGWPDCRHVRRDNELSTAVTMPPEPPRGDEKVPTRRHGSSSGYHITKVIERLEIAKELKPKTVFANNDAGALVAAGKAELEVTTMSSLMPLTCIDIVGPLPGGPAG